MPATLTIRTDRFLQGLSGRMESAIFNTARSITGFPYYRAVDLGRRAVKPVRAKALRIPLRDGSVIFRMFARPSAPRRITERSLADIGANALRASTQARAVFLRGWFVELLNAIADLHKQSLSQRTPSGMTGRLAQSFQTRKAQ